MVPPRSDAKPCRGETPARSADPRLAQRSALPPWRAMPLVIADEPIRAEVVSFVGDVHGWSDRLDRVLAQAEGTLIFLGDLIDRGPDTPGVLDRVHARCADGSAHCIMGNHEYALVCGLGVPELGIPAQPSLFAAWAQRYGGAAVLAAYRVDDWDPETLRERLGDHLPWLAALPWLLTGETTAGRWLAVHAGLSDQAMGPQLPLLRDPGAWLRTAHADLPPALYHKPRAFQVPCDLPSDVCIVSGHTPLECVHIAPDRILCDTSGGQRDRPLSAVIWPSGRVISS